MLLSAAAESSSRLYTVCWNGSQLVMQASRGGVLHSHYLHLRCETELLSGYVCAYNGGHLHIPGWSGESRVMPTCYLYSWDLCKIYPFLHPDGVMGLWKSLSIMAKSSNYAALLRCFILSMFKCFAGFVSVTLQERPKRLSFPSVRNLFYMAELWLIATFILKKCRFRSFQIFHLYPYRASRKQMIPPL